MSLDFVAIDFETANAYECGSACAVGLTTVRNGRILDTYYTLLDPRISFSPQCVRVHGIRPEDVADAPTFPDVWQTLIQIIGDMPLVAHNASFDMRVLGRLLEIWELEPIERRYTCTLSLSRALCSGAHSHRLGDLCEHLDLPDYDRHNAGADAEACARLCIRLAERVGANSMDRLLHAAGQRWRTLLPKGAAAGKQGAKKFPFISVRKKQEEIYSRFVDDPIFRDMSFVFTGELNCMSREEAHRAVEQRAGRVLGSVTKKANVLVVGTQTSPFVRGKYSTKHRMAMELRERGHAIEIVEESVFIDWLCGLKLGTLPR